MCAASGGGRRSRLGKTRRSSAHIIPTWDPSFADCDKPEEHDARARSRAHMRRMPCLTADGATSQQGRANIWPCSPRCSGCWKGKGCENGLFGDGCAHNVYAAVEHLIKCLDEESVKYINHPNTHAGEDVKLPSHPDCKTARADQWFEGSVLVSYDDSNGERTRGTFSHSHVKRPGYKPTTEQWEQYAKDCCCFEAGAFSQVKQLRFVMRKLRLKLKLKAPAVEPDDSEGEA